MELEEKELLFNELRFKAKLTKEAVIKLLFGAHTQFDLNFKEVEGNRTMAEIVKTCQTIIELSGQGEYDFAKMNAVEIERIIETVFGKLGYNTQLVHFDAELADHDLERQLVYQLWHLIYSFEGDNSNTGDRSLIDKITEMTGLEPQYAALLSNISLQQDYAALSTKAMRKILRCLRKGNDYAQACECAGYRHSKSSLTKDEIAKKVLKEKLELLPRNSLRNPVVEKILNQMVNVVNTVIERYGKPDEIHIELARELKKSAKEREDATKEISAKTAEHEKYKEILKTEFGLSHVSRNDIIRYKLYLELSSRGHKTLYSNTYIPKEKLFSKEFDIEHIIPQAKLFDDSFSNKTIESRAVNIEKGNATAFDYIEIKQGQQGVDVYLPMIEELYKSKAISKGKYNKLKMKEADIPSDFLNRDLRDSQYIAIKAKTMLEDIVRTVVSTSGSVTARLREDWQLVDVMKELNWDKYDTLGLTEVIYNRDGQGIRRIQEWTKRNDHRHHAMDALTVAFTKRSHIQYLNNLNARSDKSGSIYGIEVKELYRDDKNKLRFNPPMPLSLFRKTAKEHLGNTLISIKAKNKVVTQNVNITKKKTGNNQCVQLTPRGQLHQETIYGSCVQNRVKAEKVGGSFDETKIARVPKKNIREALLNRLAEFGNDPKKAFTGKNSLEKQPIYLDVNQTHKVPEKVDVAYKETLYTIRKPISDKLAIDKVIDPAVRAILENRLKEFGGDAKKAFSNIDENPIWLNEAKGIRIKRVTISGISNAVALHDKKDKDGSLVLDEQGRKQSVDFVSTGNNHHVAIFVDEKGALQEHIVSFFEATALASAKLPIIDKTYKQDDGWKFLFTMKQNEYFVFPNVQTGFNPNEVDLLNPENYALISPNLFRVQKMASKDYFFRHHLETTVDDNKLLMGLTFQRLSLSGLCGIVKVRVNHIGEIVSVGEY